MASLNRYRQEFLNYLQVKGFAEETIEKRDGALQRFISWCEGQHLDNPQLLSRPILERYQGDLFQHRKVNGDPLSLSTQHNHLAALKAFFKWLARENHIAFNSAAELELPKLRKQLPRGILSLDEMSRLLNSPDTSAPQGIRDKAILEALYSTGMRRRELASLTMTDVDFGSGSVFIRQGKGGIERLVPIGERALSWIERYLYEVRPLLSTTNSEQTLFLTNYGEPYIKTRLSVLVKKYLRSVGIEKEGAAHLLRHAMATHLLDNGADVRHIQELLGHQQINSTQIYTRVAIGKLKAVHKEFHPLS